MSQAMERLKEKSEKLNQYFDRVSNTIKDTESQLLDIGAYVSSFIQVNDGSLGWTKYHDNWRIVYSKTTSDYRPLIECKIHIRIECAPHIEELLLEIDKNIEQKVNADFSPQYQDLLPWENE